jgi:hypothetical protein
MVAGKSKSRFVPILSENAGKRSFRKSFCSLDFQLGINHIRPRGGVVTQRSAKPCTPVQFRAWPPQSLSLIKDMCATIEYPHKSKGTESVFRQCFGGL